MSTVLINTQRIDSHARILECALVEQGHEVYRWNGDDYPSFNTSSFRFSPLERCSWTLNSGPSAVNFNSLRACDVVWNRRPKRASIPNTVAPSDHDFVSQENAENHKGMWSVIGDGSFWVNPRQSAAFAESKMVQLHRACQLDFLIPQTLVSNDFDDIRAFINDNRTQGVVYKTFGSHTWNTENGGLARVHTTLISEEDLLRREEMQITPGIFQCKVAKKYEIRVTIMGAQSFAVRIDSQAHAEAQLDWRSAPTRELKLAEYQMPHYLEEKCRALMRSLGIVFGCFDFIVDTNGNYLFLEVNQMGQFLWVEEHLPSVPLLAAFCEFLVSQDNNFRYSNTGRLRLADVISSSRYGALTTCELNRLDLKPDEIRVL